MSVCRASAVSKLILAGEHAVLYGQGAIIVPINLRLTVELVAEETDSIIVKTKLLNPDLLIKYSQWQRLMTEYVANKEDFIQRYQLDQQARHKVIAALVIAASATGFHLFNHRLKITSTIPYGSGLGSSAAFAVALVRALLSQKKEEAPFEEIYPMAYAIERIFHGKPSGGDPITILKEKPLRFFKTPQGPFFTELSYSLAWLHKRVLLLQSGQPLANTAQTISHVRQQYEKDKNGIELIMQRLGVEAQNLEAAWKKEKAGDFSRAISEIHEQLTKLGLVSLETQNLVHELRQLGAAVKICGAGTVARLGGGSGVLLVFSEESEPLTMIREMYQDKVFEGGILA